MTTRTEQQKAYEERFTALVGLRPATVSYAWFDAGLSGQDDVVGWRPYSGVGHQISAGLELRSTEGACFALTYGSHFAHFDLAMARGGIESAFPRGVRPTRLDVSAEPPWRSSIGREVSEVEVFWCKTDWKRSDGAAWATDHPQDVAIRFGGEDPVYVCAREYWPDRDELAPMSDEVFVVFSDDAARRQRVGPYGEDLRSHGALAQNLEPPPV